MAKIFYRDHAFNEKISQVNAEKKGIKITERLC